MSQPPTDPYGSHLPHPPAPQYGYQQAPWQQQPQWGAPQQPPRKGHALRNVLLSVGGALVLLVVLVVAFGGGSGAQSPAASSSTAPADSPPAAPAAAAPGIGQAVRDGDFAFTVRSWICGAPAAAAVAGSDGFGETLPAGAVECIATMTVTDDKAQAQTFFDGAQFAYDAKGRQFSADSNGSIYLAGDQDATQLNPGVTITAKVPYQIPAGTTIVRLMLHDSDFSNGVTVRLGS